jgi:hypothetical protein
MIQAVKNCRIGCIGTGSRISDKVIIIVKLTELLHLLPQKSGLK